MRLSVYITFGVKNFCEEFQKQNILNKNQITCVSNQLKFGYFFRQQYLLPPLKPALKFFKLCDIFIVVL